LHNSASNPRARTSEMMKRRNLTQREVRGRFTKIGNLSSAVVCWDPREGMNY
jgi:hypothetical protein